MLLQWLARDCGCDERAVRLVRWLGIDLPEWYVRKYHFRATLLALYTFGYNAVGRLRR